MKTKLILIALLALLCMAPNYYLPLASRPCPVPTITSMFSAPFSIYYPQPYLANIDYGMMAPAMDVVAYDVETGQRLSSLEPTRPEWLDWGSGVRVAFPIRDCSLTGSPYQVRFEIEHVGGCVTNTIGEFIPEDIWCSWE